MDDQCICKWDSDCRSGRCELFTTGICEPQLGIGARCNEDPDCLSGYCSWKFRCENPNRIAQLETELHAQQTESNKKWDKIVLIPLVPIGVVVSIGYGIREYLRRVKTGYEVIRND